MKRILAVLLFSTLLLPLRAQYRQGYEELYDSETVRALKKHVFYLSSALLEGRKAGGEGELLAAQYLGKALEVLARALEAYNAR